MGPIGLMGLMGNFNLSTFPLDLWSLDTSRTFQLFNISTFQHFNISTFQHFNFSTFQHFNFSTFQLYQCASSQFEPHPASAISGTLSSTAFCISSITICSTRSRSSGRTEKFSSSCTCRIICDCNPSSWKRR